MERSSNCDAIHNCSPTLIRLALLGTFPGGEGIRCGADGPTKIFVSGSVWPIVFTAALVALIVFLLVRKK